MRSDVTPFDRYEGLFSWYDRRRLLNYAGANETTSCDMSLLTDMIILASASASSLNAGGFVPVMSHRRTNVLTLAL